MRLSPSRKRSYVWNRRAVLLWLQRLFAPAMVNCRPPYLLTDKAAYRFFSDKGCILYSPPCLKSEKTSGDFNGVQLAVYDRETHHLRLFQSTRTKLDNEMFNKALNAYAADKKKNLSNLSSYAKGNAGL